MVKRRPESQRWDGELQVAVNSVPWLIDGPVTTPESGSEFTSGCKACDEERTAVKRRHRSFHHTTESNERQAAFRARLREMKMLSAGDASALSPVLDLTSGIVPVLSGPNAIAEPSSSNSEVVVQPMAVDLDMFESCGLKSGLESGNLESAAVCSFIPCVSENEETRQVVNAEPVRLTEFQGKKYGMLNYRLCVRPFG